MDENGVAIFLGLLCGDSLRYQARFLRCNHMIVEETTKHGGIVRLQWDSNEINFTNLICLFDLVWGVEILNMGEMGETDQQLLTGGNLESR